MNKLKRRITLNEKLKTNAKFFSELSIIGIFFLATNSCINVMSKNNQMKDALMSDFKIYISKNPNLDLNKPDQSQKLLDSDNLTEILVSTSDIEYFDWENQLIFLNSKKNFNISSEKIFIITLGNRKIFSGKIINPLSARVIKHIVIYKAIFKNKTVLVLRPNHDYQYLLKDNLKLPNSELKKSMTIDLKNYFEKIDKFKITTDKDFFDDFFNIFNL